MVKSPITGELIPVNEMEEHMRISLIEPKYKEQKERMMAKLRETTLAPDDEISRNIMGLARTRPDIFGTTEEEVSNAVMAEIEVKKDEPKQVIWDGHTGSIYWAHRHSLQGMAFKRLKNRVRYFRCSNELVSTQRFIPRVFFIQSFGWHQSVKLLQGGW